ncbi:PE domain-containing protein [Nocardia yunnanensis]|uniref:PE domain-containing protein n=1 Tax=Nocardia yunnanensis TaxID=2382165 RepID=A0A386ZHM6_9NOCA|nr:PE family protein [Nocardia yunnanensis]AYF77058.1 PE domain-containing protein [Nocardia yunnanensis]
MSEFNLGGVRFDADAVRAAAADLDAMADRLEHALGADGQALAVPAAGSDAVSLAAADTLTSVGASFVAQSGSGVDELRKLAALVRGQADAFGQVEVDNSADFTNL